MERAPSPALIPSGGEPAADADSEDSIFVEDEEEEDDPPIALSEPFTTRPSIAGYKRYSKLDANSIVGGQSIQEDTPQALPNQTDSFDGKLSDSQKVFTFSLPFGGLLGLRNNVVRQFQLLRRDIDLPSLPFTKNGDIDPDLEEIRLRLQRQQSVSTIDEARWFQSIKGTDAVRLRAVKHSLLSNLNYIIPDFINKRGEKPHETIYNEIEGNIVFLGGYRGSILRDAQTKKRLWIPLKAGFHLRKINLLLGPTREDELNATDFIYPDGVLKNIGPIDICKKLIKKLSSNHKTNVKEFGYDWRLSLDIVSDQLVEFLTRLNQQTGKKTLVVAHSMGGLVTHLAMQKNPGLFRGIIYVGVPSECLNILGPIRFGDSVIFSDKILTYESNFMMRSSFAFLPLSGRVFCNRDTNEWYDLDYFDPDTWVEYNLNPLVSKTRKLEEENRLSAGNSTSPSTPMDPLSSLSTINSISSKIRNYRPIAVGKKILSDRLSPKASPPPDPSPVGQSPLRGAHPNPPKLPSLAEMDDHIPFSTAYNYLSETLRTTKEFVLSLDYNEELEDEYPPLAMVYGNKVPSVRGSNVSGLNDIKEGLYYEFFYGHGDGVVHQRWLMPEKKGFSFFNKETGEGQIVGKFSSDAGHVNLMTDLKAMGYALRSIVEAEKVWKEKKRLRVESMKLKAESIALKAESIALKAGLQV